MALIEIDGLPNFKMVDLSMAMLNNQMVYMCMYIYINGTTNRQNRQAPDKPIGATCHVDALYTDI